MISHTATKPLPHFFLSLSLKIPLNPNLKQSHPLHIATHNHIHADRNKARGFLVLLHNDGRTAAAAASDEQTPPAVGDVPKRRRLPRPHLFLSPSTTKNSIYWPRHWRDDLNGQTATASVPSLPDPNASNQMCNARALSLLQSDHKTREMGRDLARAFIVATARATVSVKRTTRWDFCNTL